MLQYDEEGLLRQEYLSRYGDLKIHNMAYEDR
jgi:hypothetical protein